MEPPGLTAFDDIHTHFYKKAFHFTKSYVHDARVAEDIVSESMLKLWEQIRRNQVTHPEVFLLTILKITLKEMVRRLSPWVHFNVSVSSSLAPPATLTADFLLL